jgi:hypothetical protein
MHQLEEAYMIEESIMQEKQGNTGETFSMSESAGAHWKPQGNEAVNNPATVCESGNGGCEAATAEDPGKGANMRTAPGQTHCDSRSDSGEAGSGSAGFGVGCGEQQGSESPYMHGAWNPGAGPQQMGANPGQAPHYGPYMYNPGYYENPAFGPPMGGPHQYVHPGMGHHAGCSAHAGMHWHPHQGPHFGPSQDPGFGGRHTGHEEQNYGQFADMVGKALQGQANPQDLLSGLLNLNFSGDQFWKGIVVGSVAALLVSNDSMRQAITGALGGIFGNPLEKAKTEGQKSENAS